MSTAVVVHDRSAATCSDDLHRFVDALNTSQTDVLPVEGYIYGRNLAYLADLADAEALVASHALT